MNQRFIKALSVLLMIAGVSTGLFAQQNPPKPQPSPEVELERLRIELQERARQENEQRDWETKIFEIKYAEPYHLREALSLFRAVMNRDPHSRLLSIRAPKEIMPAIEDVIKRLDVPSPSKSAELTVFILLASDRDQPEAGSTVPASLQPVVNQLRNVLSYKNYRLVDTLLVRGSDGRDFSLKGVLPVTGASFPLHYSLSGLFHVEQPDPKTAVVRLRGMRFGILAPINNQFSDLNINTDVDIPRGQQVVVGKTQFGDTAYILVMTSKFD